MASGLEVRFVSKNKKKLAEAQSILGSVGVKVIAAEVEIAEIQTANTETLIKDKLLKAYKRIGRPLFVEHTGLYLARLNELPGGLTQIFWDALEAEKFSDLFGSEPNNEAIARTYIAYSDGKRIRTFSGEIKGKIVAKPRGSLDFQWDPVFQPDGCDQTFAEMGESKNEISMRRLALDKFAAFLKEDAR